MASAKNPFSVIVTMLLLGAFLSAVARFAYVAYVIVQAGKALDSVPLELLLTDVMELHWFALYGAGGGAVFGIVLVLVDRLRYGGQGEDHSRKVREDVDPFAGDEVKLRRMEMGDRYLKDHPPPDQNDNTK